MLRVRLATAALFTVLAAAPAARPAGVDDEGRQTHTVASGQTLGKIARRYHVSVEALCRVNHLRYGAPIKPGQTLVVPDGEDDPGKPLPPKGKGTRWEDYVEHPRRRGLVVLQSQTGKWRGYVLSAKGKLLPHAKEAIERVLASWRTGKRHEIDPRLVRLIVKMSDTFGGRPIRVVSGYRERSYAFESKHKVGRAFDFSIPGIPNGVLKDYLRSLKDVGVGYYPNSTHLHVDVREASAYWIDESRPGERPRYTLGGARPAPEADEPASDLDLPESTDTPARDDSSESAPEAAEPHSPESG